VEKRTTSVRYDALENNLSGDPLVWNDKGGHLSITVTPVRTFKTDEGVYCREYRQSVNSKGRANYNEGLACRNNSGEWPNQTETIDVVELFDLGQIHEYENKIAFQIWKSDRLILHSKNAPTFPMTSNAGYSDGQIEGVLWRFLLRRDEASGMSVIVAEEYAVRQELVTQITLQQFWPIIIVIPLLILLVQFSVNSGLRPLIELAQQIKNRGVNQLDPISMEHVPNEMETTISNINNLLRKLQDARDSERQFTSDASHELRTPLAALKAQAQVAQRTKKDDVRSHALEKVIEGVERSSQLVEQLLTLTRLEPDSLDGEFEVIEVSRNVQESTAQIAHLALEREIEISLNLDEKLQINGIATLLSSLVSNLLKNALIYTPKGGSVVVSVYGDDGDVYINVSDTGPGIADVIKGRVFDRFYRVPGSEQVGSGLGLSIVKRITEIHSWAIDIGTADAGGASITVKMPKQ
jgi:two-component system sensor histidine kinase QseC